MPDWGTMVQTISEDTRSAINSDRIKRFACDAMELHRDKKMWFADGSGSFDLRNGKADYEIGVDIPHRIQEIVGDSMWVTYSTSGDDRVAVDRVTRDQMSHLRAYNFQNGDPTAFDIYNNTIRLWPIPNESSQRIFFDYVENIAVPTYKYAAASWSFIDENGKAMTDAWTNSWLKHDQGWLLTKYRILNFCFKDLKDLDAANLNFVLWLEVKSSLESITDSKAGPSHIEPRFF